MNCTDKLFETTLTNFFPFGKQILTKGRALKNDGLLDNNEGHSSSIKSVSRRQEKARLATARLMEKHIQNGRLDRSYEQKVKKMKYKAQQRLAESNFEKRNQRHSFLHESQKAAPILGHLVPGADFILTTSNRLAVVLNAEEFAEESPSLKESVIKTTSAIAPVILSATSHIWSPYIKPWEQTLVIGTMGTVVALDVLHYLKRKVLN